jgi:hypothetical protein
MTQDRRYARRSSPRSPAQNRFPGADGIVFNFPWLFYRRREIARSLSPGIDRHRQKYSPSLWPRRTFSRRTLCRAFQRQLAPFCGNHAFCFSFKTLSNS